MRARCLSGHARLLLTGWRLAVTLGMTAAAAGTFPGTPSASAAPRLPRAGYAAPGPALRLARAPAALRAAVRRAAGLPPSPVGSAFQQAKLTAADAAAGDNFGFSVALSRSTAVVGAPPSQTSATATGAAYVFASV